MRMSLTRVGNMPNHQSYPSIMWTLIQFVYIQCLSKRGIYARQLGHTGEGQHLQVQFQLPDNTASDHFVGNILGVSHKKHQFARAMLTPDHLFRLDNNGDLFTKDALDRDAICGSLGCCETDVCHIELEAYLFDSRPTPTAVNVDIYVTDANDNAPLFPHRQTEYSNSNLEDLEENVWEISIPESASVGSRHTLPTATDKDSPRFGVQNYRLLPATEKSSNRILTVPDTFCSFEMILPPRTGAGQQSVQVPELQLGRPLDREQKSYCDFQLIAEDAGSPPLSSRILIRVNILDANDNAPIFTNLSAAGSIITIPESTAVGSMIYKFSVQDIDDGPNGEVLLSVDWASTYPGLNQTMIQRLSTKYNLNPKTGELRVVQPLDYESQLERRLLLVVKASDQGSPRLTSTTTLTVLVTDVNDNSPTIEVFEVGQNDENTAGSSGGESALLMENEAEPKLLKLISVTDMDSVSIGKVSCHLSKQHQDDFQLTPYSNIMYGLVNSRAFDYEREASQTGHLAVRIECMDDAEPKRSTQQWIQIPLVDTNDNWPQFSRVNYQFHVAEDVLVGTEVGRVVATDADSSQSGELFYELSSDKPEFLSFFRINSKTGSIYTTTRMDRESLDVLEFHITASDGGDAQSGGTSVLDSPEGNRKLSNIKSNTTGLTVFITDVNDNPPVYTGPTEMHITEGVPVGTEIPVSIEFRDPDLGSNGTVHISLVQSHSRYAEPLDGVGVVKLQDQPIGIIASSKLVTTGEIDREHRAQFILLIVAVDQGESVQLTTTASITVHVDDVNDNPPTLIYPRNGSLLYGLIGESDWMSKLSTIPADTAPNTLVITIRGKDLDSGANGTITYHLMPEPQWVVPDNEKQTDERQNTERNSDLLNGFNYFVLDETEGHLTTYWGLPDEDNEAISNNGASLMTNLSSSVLKRSKSNTPPEPGLYVLHVELRDGGVPSLVTSATFYVNISEAVGGIFGLAFFTSANMSNTIILVLIMVCSLALIISLTAAIFWVRFRKDTAEQASNNGRQYSGYLGPTVICQDSVPNGFYYPSSYAQLGSPLTVRDYDPSYASQDATLLSEKQRIYKHKLSDCGLECCHNGTFQPGMTVGTMVPRSHGESNQLEYVMDKGTPMSPVSSYPEAVHILPVGSCSELHLYQPSCQPPNGLPEWSATTDHALLDPMVSFSSDVNYTTPAHYEMFNHSQPTGNNNSCGGSDSGVDSGAGVTGPPGVQTLNYSPTGGMTMYGKPPDQHLNLPKTTQITLVSCPTGSGTLMLRNNNGDATPNVASFLKHTWVSENVTHHKTYQENIAAS
ncbi:hypothetical protein CRM22_006079 [Opisthorchis felineus]|uniref:Cadherin domain-containing protein n=1 Tax=Opisthorchis felineus TaxID=147828 RepID=A0A4S2LPC6_OPIFE|nr:hypothetical protein CRM22_006079 [Opisthorchis felineus]TGZ64975.1 hypothetical protein CRM22_006079 [Opisthorchis felineus]TGZ64976.1 hypothetical protein CRM22_006079 [Opisthorchis felineus]TGZ64977.1 hypothetical protein CRM22_006079 [Opisthorchis felineus]